MVLGYSYFTFLHHRTLSDHVIVVQMNSKRPSVELYENNGDLIRAFKGGFRTPSHVAWNDDYGILAVSDGEQQCVQLFDVSGKLLKMFGRVPAGTASTQQSASSMLAAPITLPAGICWADPCRLLVADRSDHRVASLDIRNFTIHDILTDAVDGLRNPVSIATNKRNRIVLTEETYDFAVDEHRLKMFRLMTSEQF